MSYTHEKISHMEFFELEHVDAAIARFEELSGAITDAPESR